MLAIGIRGGISTGKSTFCWTLPRSDASSPLAPIDSGLQKASGSESHTARRETKTTKIWSGEIRRNHTRRFRPTFECQLRFVLWENIKHTKPNATSIAANTKLTVEIPGGREIHFHPCREAEQVKQQRAIGQNHTDRLACLGMTTKRSLTAGRQAAL